MMFEGNRPIEGNSQEIGRLAQIAFIANKPLDWIEAEPPGQTDFGYDYSIQVKNQDGELLFPFWVQLKGTRSPNYIKNNKYLSFTIQVKSLNYYRTTESAVLLVVADLSKSDEPNDCPLYYYWLDEDSLDQIGGKRTAQESVSFRVPVSNKLSRKLNILDYYRARLERRESAILLSRAVATHSNNPAEEIKKLAEVISESPIFLQASKDTSGVPWLTNPEEMIAGILFRADQEIKSNRIEHAIKLIEKAERKVGATQNELAELHYLKGYVKEINGSIDEAHELYRQAYNYHERSRYKVSYFESLIRNNSEKIEDIKLQVNESLDEEKISECTVKAKYYALAGMKEEALGIIEKHPHKKTAIARCVILSIVDDITLNDELNEIQESDLNASQRVVYHAIFARSYFALATENSLYGKTGYISIKGVEGYDPNYLSKSLHHSQEAMVAADEIGYPPNIYPLLETAILVFSYFNQEEVLIAYLEKILSGRPNARPIVDALVPLLSSQEAHEKVLFLLQPLAELSPSQAAHLINSLYSLGRKRDVVDVALRNEGLLLKATSFNQAAILCIAAECAFEIFSPENEKHFLSLLAVVEGGENAKLYYDYLRSCKEFPDRNNELSKSLFEECKNKGFPITISEQLLNKLDPEVIGNPERILELCSSILKNRALLPSENSLIAFAYTKLQLWDQLLGLAEERLNRGHGNEDIWHQFKACALDKLGRSHEALEALDASVSQSYRSIERAEQFVTLSMQLGFYDKAVDKLNELLEKTHSNEKRIKILETFILIFSSDVEPEKRLIPALQRYGSMIDRNDEAAEGHYLNLFLMVSLSIEKGLAEEIPKFRLRLKDYTERYPNSSFLQKHSIDDGDEPAKVLEKFRKIAGVSDDQIKIWRRNRNLLRNDNLPIPYALVPKMLDDVRDIFSAWILSKHCGSERGEYQLRRSRSADQPCIDQELSDGASVLLDLTALIILKETGFLEVVLEKINGICIVREDYHLLLASSHARFGSPAFSLPREILEVCKKYLYRIRLVSPSASEPLEIGRYDAALADNCVELLCTDDFYLSEYIKRGGGKVINTTNIIQYLSSVNIIEKDDSVLFVERLCSLGIRGVSLAVRQVVDSLEKNISGTQGVDILKTSFAQVFNVIVAYKSSPESSLKNLSLLFAVYINRNSMGVDISDLASLVSVWMIRVPAGSAIDLITMWYVETCKLTNLELENSEIEVSNSHSKLWRLAVKVAANHGWLDQTELLKSAHQKITRLGETDYRKVLHLMLLSHFPGSREREVISEQHRLFLMSQGRRLE